MQVNWDRGFRRIVWVVSSLCVALGIGLFVYGVTVRANQNKRLEHFRQVETEVHQDPQYIAMTPTNQKAVIEGLREKLGANVDSNEWKGFLYGGLLFAASSFLILWGVFWMIRWIIHGFSKRS